jgi:hypothetical protein
MPFDPTLPVSHSPVASAELRDQFNGLKELIDAKQDPLGFTPEDVAMKDVGGGYIGKNTNLEAGALGFYATGDGGAPGIGAEKAAIRYDSQSLEGQVVGDLIAKFVAGFPTGLPKVPTGTDPTDDDEITRKKYVDDQVATRMPANTLILLSPNGHRWQASIGDDGTLSWTDLGL